MSLESLSSPQYRRWSTRLLLMTLFAMAFSIHSTPSAYAQDDDPAPVADKPDKTKKKEIEYPLQNRIRMPADVFDGAVDWLNVSGPIELKDLRGKIVLIDFWTYCCINCIHVLPDLKYLEEKYENELVVIGCHSAKFDNEKETANIRDAILRYEIKHPVINDANMRIWRRIGVRSWPSLLLIDAEGQACLLLSGEGHRETLDTVIGALVKYHRATGTLDESPMRFDLEQNDTKPTSLRFPGKVLADADNDRLFISDSNHNRIVITRLDGELLDVIGSGKIGEADGSYDEASFDHPQGMALVDQTLYVADTENHLIRTVDLQRKTVSTLAGTGKQARWGNRGGKLKTSAISSPWDLLHFDGVLYIAMAGPHQIWSHKLGSDSIGVFSGSGREDVLNGPHASAALAQPSGLATDGKYLYVCDSEGSSIRQLDLDPDGKTETIVGPSEMPRGQTLFAFGDIDGKADEARFQHPLGIAHIDGKLYVADSYNHKLREVDIKTREVTTWLGDGTPGDQLEPAARVSEPAGLAIANGQLYIADTNNHRILVADLKTKAVKPLDIPKLSPPKIADTASDDSDTPLEEAPEQTVAANRSVTLKFKLNLPEGYKVNKQFPARVKIAAKPDQTVIVSNQLDKRQPLDIADGELTYALPLTGKEGSTTAELSLNYGYCRDGKSGLCKLHSVRWTIPLTVAKNAKESQINLAMPIPKTAPIGEANPFKIE
ncbi:thioredoxin-like domain-containing protein [Thalassoroseus pseudoceratinae]|uniref:thioredoxin-like domain-containing protein n=1 Tax=Thalassoroseus pseudoceratinae TaxID=2713176 RepID=UPI001F0E899A|nr:thioredoxin-like domain-containing protein [Thalassoroseus pseudoceratinae]